MSDFEEQTITALKNLFEKVETLRQMDIREMLDPDMYYHYEDTLQTAYDALTSVEDALSNQAILFRFFLLHKKRSAVKCLRQSESGEKKCTKAFRKRCNCMETVI